MTDFSQLGAVVSRHLRADAADPAWPDRDRVVLCGDASAGLPAHAEIRAQATDLPGPPGQAFGAAVGMALAERLLAARFGRSLVDHRTWLLAGPAELAAGTAHESAAIAGAIKLGRLTVLAILPPAQEAAIATVAASFAASFAALGWTVRRPDQADTHAVESAVTAALRSQKPTLILAIGAPNLPEAPPPSHRGPGARRAWLKRLRRHAQADAFNNAIAGRLVVPWPTLATADPVPPALMAATAIGALSHALPELVLLPPEPHTADPAGIATISWAGRAQAAAAALLGLALHGGLLPVGRFTLRDAEALRPALRSAAALNLRSVYLLTEPASACAVGGLRAGWRAMRNLLVLRPADGAESAECLALALRRTAGPSLLLLATAPAHPLAVPQTAPHPPRAVARGGYLLLDPPHRTATLIAAGPDLHLALDLQIALAGSGVEAAILSLPCWTLFAAQDPAYRAAALGNAPRIGLESGSGSQWAQWLGPDGLFIDTGDAADAATLLPGLLRFLAASAPRAHVLDSAENLLESDDTID